MVDLADHLTPDQLLAHAMDMPNANWFNAGVLTKRAAQALRSHGVRLDDIRAAFRPLSLPPLHYSDIVQGEFASLTIDVNEVMRVISVRTARGAFYTQPVDFACSPLGRLAARFCRYEMYDWSAAQRLRQTGVLLMPMCLRAFVSPLVALLVRQATFLPTWREYKAQIYNIAGVLESGDD